MGKVISRRIRSTGWTQYVVDIGGCLSSCFPNKQTSFSVPMWGRVATCIGCIGVALFTLLAPWHRRFGWAPAGSAIAASGNITPAAQKLALNAPQTATRPPCQFCPAINALRVWESSDLSVRTDLEVLWPANGTLEVSVDKEVEALVVAKSLKNLYAAPFVFAWIRSADDTLLTAEAGVPVPVKFGRRSTMIEKWVLSFRLQDPGQYTVLFLAVVPSPAANISDPRAFKIQAVGSPQRLKVSEASGALIVGLMVICF